MTRTVHRLSAVNTIQTVTAENVFALHDCKKAFKGRKILKVFKNNRKRLTEYKKFSKILLYKMIFCAFIIYIR